VEHSKAVRRVSRLEDLVGEAPPTGDESSGCRDRWGSISRPGGLRQERILLQNRWWTVLGRLIASQKRYDALDAETKSADLGKCGSIYTQRC